MNGPETTNHNLQQRYLCSHSRRALSNRQELYVSRSNPPWKPSVEIQGRCGDHHVRGNYKDECKRCFADDPIVGPISACVSSDFQERIDGGPRLRRCVRIASRSATRSTVATGCCFTAGA